MIYSFSLQRYLNTLQLDLKIQFRNGFYHVATVMTVIWIVIFTQLSDRIIVDLFALFLLTNLGVGTFLFIGAIVLFEKDERSLDAVIMTPLSFQEYLLSKISSLVLLAIFENGLLIGYLATRIDLSIIVLLAGIVIMSIIYILIGFAFVVRFTDITEYIIPAVGIIAYLQLPVLTFFGFDSQIWQILYYLTPLQPALVLLQSGITLVSTAKLLISIFGCVLWLIVSMWIAKREYNHHILGSSAL